VKQCTSLIEVMQADEVMADFIDLWKQGMAKDDGVIPVGVVKGFEASLHVTRTFLNAAYAAQVTLHEGGFGG